MAELIVFPDAVAALVDHLSAVLAPTEAHTEVPSPRPANFVTLRRVGGVRRSLVVDEPSIAVEAWGPNEGAATDLAQLARAVIHAAVGASFPNVGTIYRVVEFAGPASLPDPDSDQARVTFTVAVSVRGRAV